MKILNFIACIILPISTINSGYTMENNGYQNPIFDIFINNSNNSLLDSHISINRVPNLQNTNTGNLNMEDTEYQNPILKILRNSSENTILTTYINTSTNNNIVPKSQNINITNQNSDSHNNSNVENTDVKFLYWDLVNMKNDEKPNINNNKSNINISNFKNDVSTKYEKLIHEVSEIAKLLSSNNVNIKTQEVMNIINNIFDNINSKNKNINIVSLKQICDKYDKYNVVFNKVKDSNILKEHKIIKLIESLIVSYIEYISYKQDVNDIDQINKELKNEIDKIADQIINRNNKYNGAEVKVVVNKNLDRRSKLEQEVNEIYSRYMNNEEELFNILNLKNRFICNNLMHNISIDAYKTGKVEMTTLYEILNNDKYISNYNIADDIYNNIACQNLEYSHKIVTCLENILKIKDELEQIWSNFKNNENKI